MRSLEEKQIEMAKYISKMESDLQAKSVITPPPGLSACLTPGICVHGSTPQCVNCLNTFGISSIRGTTPPSTPGRQGGMDLSNMDSDPNVLSRVDQLIGRLQASEKVIKEDAAGGGRGSPATSWIEINTPTSGTTGGTHSPLENSPASGVQEEISRLEELANNPRDAALVHLRRYEDLPKFPIGGDAKVRIAPPLIAKLYKNGHCPSRRWRCWSKRRNLWIAILLRNYLLWVLSWTG